MNIQALTPKFLQNRKSLNTEPNSTVRRSNLINSNANTASYPNLRPLGKDTVSFGQASQKMSDFVSKAFSKDRIRKERIATTFLDTLEAVTTKLKEHGFSFDRVYCELSPVKSSEACASKVIRSKSFKVPDEIRATIYCNSPYDLDNLNLLLGEMKKRGYVLDNAEMSIKELMKRGYNPSADDLKDVSKAIEVPDLDIRLEDVNDQISKLPQELKYSVGHPQKSGYEDIQIRFIRDFDLADNPMPHELIILFGPNYAQAKHIESEMVYANLRKFGELNMKFTDKTIGSNQQKAARYIDLIQEMFRGKVSKKLFLNAKNKDLYDLSDELLIAFTKEDSGMLANYFNGLRARVQKCYNDAKNTLNPSNYAVKQLITEHRQDTKTINEIEKGLTKTIDYFNYQNDLKIK